MKCRLFVGSLFLLDRVDQSQNQLAPWFGLGLYQEEGVGEAVDLQGIGGVKALGMESMGSGSISAERASTVVAKGSSEINTRRVRVGR